MPSSGGPIEGFSGGWALLPFSGERCHLWEVVHNTAAGGIFRSRCGVKGSVTYQVPALAPGDMPRCRNCERGRR